MSDTDGPVIGDGPARVVRDFPHVAIGVGEGSGHAAPLGACRRPHDLPAGLLGLGKDDRNLFGGSNILREFDTGCAVAPERGPEPQDHATSLEEADLLVRLLCAAPAHRLIKGSGPGQIADAEGYQTDALLHLASIAVDYDTREPCCHLYAASARRASVYRPSSELLLVAAGGIGEQVVVVLDGMRDAPSACVWRPPSSSAACWSGGS